MSKAITILDIAARVGVSGSTVSAVLGSRPSRHVRVSEATRERILEAAREMQYRPNGLARSLRYSKTDVIGAYSAYGYLHPSAHFTSQIVGGLHAGCEDHRKNLLLHGSYRDRSANEVYSELLDGRIDGLVVYARDEDPLVEFLVGSTLPVVAIVDAVAGLPSVVVDDESGARILARYLTERGHSRVAYAANRPPLVSSERRKLAFAQEAEACGLTVSEIYPSSAHEHFTESDLDWLSQARETRSTAVVCWNDETAYNFLDHCRRRNVAVPHDIAVVGFDGILPPVSMQWQLTTIRAPWVDVARASVGLLLRRIDGEQLLPETRIPVEFVQGNTA